MAKSARGVVASKDDNRLAVAKINAVSNTITVLGSRLMKYGAVCFVAYCGYLSIKELAGKTTIADMVFKMVGDWKVNQWLAYVLAGGGVIYGYKQRSLRKKRVNELSQRLTELETAIDSKRSSSKLLPTGNTRKEDKI